MRPAELYEEEEVRLTGMLRAGADRKRHGGSFVVESKPVDREKVTSSSPKNPALDQSENDGQSATVGWPERTATSSISVEIIAQLPKRKCPLLSFLSFFLSATPFRSPDSLLPPNPSLNPLSHHPARHRVSWMVSHLRLWFCLSSFL
jgi:hypothetical protein